MLGWGTQKLKALEKEQLCGFIFKSKSPSSGMERVKVYNDQGAPSHNGVGVWARMFMEHFPLLPAEDDGRLHDPKLREMFIERIFVFKRWRALVRTAPSLGKLIDFHTKHKLLLMSHSPALYQKLGRIVAEGKKHPPDVLFDDYLHDLTKAMSLKTTVKKNINVLHHLLGYFKKRLTPDEKREFLDITDQYARGLIPLIVPVTLINHYVRKYDQPYLAEQYYLRPHPRELKLRNHA